MNKVSTPVFALIPTACMVWQTYTTSPFTELRIIPSAGSMAMPSLLIFWENTGVGTSSRATTLPLLGAAKLISPFLFISKKLHEREPSSKNHKLVYTSITYDYNLYIQVLQPLTKHS